MTSTQKTRIHEVGPRKGPKRRLNLSRHGVLAMLRVVSIVTDDNMIEKLVIDKRALH